jgi:hypothetical protein
MFNCYQEQVVTGKIKLKTQQTRQDHWIKLQKEDNFPYTLQSAHKLNLL